MVLWHVSFEEQKDPLGVRWVEEKNWFSTHAAEWVESAHNLGIVRLAVLNPGLMCLCWKLVASIKKLPLVFKI